MECSLAGCWQEALVSCPMESSTELLEFPQYMASPRWMPARLKPWCLGMHVWSFPHCPLGPAGAALFIVGRAEEGGNRLETILQADCHGNHLSSARTDNLPHSHNWLLTI
ncbi:hypothetical protein MG293_004047 [Ovis ammon polii]|uniref:Uncharacterized protein n=1 Tax=Ovis ammon polii TaxID=230172 RepID=A0AAD4UMP0_OVIAM|nr:hypothetical protein MG293_004047 [Ovis ammon polii]